VNTDGGFYKRPLVAALAGDHFQTADLLHHNGADLHVRGRWENVPLHPAAYTGSLEVVKKLIEYDPAYINARDMFEYTPLLCASGGLHFKDSSTFRLLLERGADIDVQEEDGWTPLHVASRYGALEVMRLLLEHGVDIEAKDKTGKTPLQSAATSDEGVDRLDEVVKLLREHGAK
jgi:ankyrin repeat protein